MKNVIETLERYYQSLEKQVNPFNFFLALTDYVVFVQKTKELKGALSSFIVEKKQILERIERQVRQALLELKDAEKGLLKIVKGKNISHDESKEILMTLENFFGRKNGWSDGTTLIEVAEEINRILNKLAKIISEAGYGKHIKQFKNIMIYQDIESLELSTEEEFIFSKTLLEERLSGRCLAENRKTELWGCWDYLSLLPEAFLTDHDLVVCTFALPDWRDDGLINEYYDLLGIMRVVRRPHLITTQKAKLDAEKRIKEKIDIYKISVLRVHNYLIQELDKEEGKKITEKQIKEKVVIDLQRGIYNVADRKLIYEIARKRLSVVDYLCKNNTASLFDLSACTEQRDSLIVKEIKQINKNFRKCLKVKKDLITHSKTGGGYRLNRNELDIKTLT